MGNIEKIYLDRVVELESVEREVFGEEAYSLSQLEEMIKNLNYHMYIYLNEDKIQGYIFLLDSFDCYEIIKIGVSNSLRGKGIGGRLLDYILKKYDKDIFLEVKEGNIMARNFYKKNNFKEIGRRKNYYRDGETAILMSISN